MRDMNTAPQGTLATPLGVVHYTMTEAAHVFLHTESRENEVVTIRGIPYHLSYHCHLLDNGTWGPKDYHEPYLSRKDCYKKESSQAARKTVAEVLSKAWTEYLADHPNLTRKAALASATYKVEHLEGEVADLAEKLDAKMNELKTAKERLSAI